MTIEQTTHYQGSTPKFAFVPATPKANFNEPILKAQNLKFYYGKQQALDIENLVLEKGKITALIGNSGSGKSTLLRTFNLIYKLYPNQRATGSVYFKGQSILTNSIDVTRLRSKIGMVFQKPSPFPVSIYNNVAFAIKAHEALPRHIMRERVQDALEQAVLWPEVKACLKKPATELSGGQQQRLCIARTIATQPEVLLLDEPTSALDPKATRHIETLLLKLKKKVTIVLVTHNLQQAQRVSDNTVFLHEGRVVEAANTQQLFHKPQHELTRDYVCSEPMA